MTLHMLKLVNDERRKVHIASKKGYSQCTGSAYDWCPASSYDRATCVGNAYDKCTSRDYAACENAYDVCTVDTYGCYNGASDRT